MARPAMPENRSSGEFGSLRQQPSPGSHGTRQGKAGPFDAFSGPEFSCLPFRLKIRACGINRSSQIVTSASTL